MKAIGPLTRTTLWTGFRAAGATCLGEVTWEHPSLVTTWRDTGDHDLRGRVQRDSEAGVALLSGDFRVLCLERAGGDFDEWLVTEVHDSRRGATLDIQAKPPRAYLGTLLPVTEKYPSTAAPVVQWTRTMPVAQFWYYELDPSHGQLPAWISKGTWANETLTVTVTCDRTNPLALLLQLADAITAQTGERHIVDLRPVGTTGMALDIVPAAGSAEVRIEEERNLAGLRIERRRLAHPTIIAPGTSDGLGLPDGWWRVASGSGTGWVLAGWDGMPAPVPFDDCWNGSYLQKHDGTFVQITDCAAPGSITVASGTGLAAGNLVQLPFDAAGTPLLALADPLRTADLFARRDYPIPGRTNFLQNGDFGEWSGGVPIGWTPTIFGGATYAEEVNTIAWEYGGAAVFWQFDGVTGGAPTLYMAQTLAMPHRLRNRIWYAQVRAWASGAVGCSLALDLTTASGLHTALFEIGGRSGVDDWVVATFAFDETAAGVGAWTGGVRVRIYQGATLPARNGYLDLVTFGLDDVADPVFGSGPGRLLAPVGADLLAARTPTRYDAAVTDRARADFARFSHEAFPPGGVGRLVAPSRGVDTRIRIAEMTVQEQERTKTRLALADAPTRLSTSS